MSIKIPTTDEDLEREARMELGRRLVGREPQAPAITSPTLTKFVLGLAALRAGKPERVEEEPVDPLRALDGLPQAEQAELLRELIRGREARGEDVTDLQRELVERTKED